MQTFLFLYLYFLFSLKFHRSSAGRKSIRFQEAVFLKIHSKKACSLAGSTNCEMMKYNELWITQ